MVNNADITCDVAVVGAGLVGLAAVIALAIQGKNVVLVDAKPKAGKQTKAWDTRIYAITPSTEAFLKELGVWSLLDTQRVNDVTAMALWQQGVDAPLHLSAEDASIPKMACIAENSNLMQALWQKIEALDVTVMMASPCLTIQTSDDSVALSLSDNRQISARLLVAADGSNSFVRQQLGITTNTKDFNQTALVANYAVEKAHGNMARQWFAPHETLALLPLPKQQVSMVWALETELAQGLLGHTDEDLAARVQSQSHHVLGELKPISKTLSFALRQITARQLVAERVVLIGDAAHQVHPMAGQGANLGFRDVISLSGLIASSHPMQDIGELAFLRRFERARKTDIVSMNSLTSGLDALFSSESAAIKNMTTLGMQQLDRHASIKNILIKQAIA